MERNFNNEFERFLKENADQYRLYPSSKVWNGIYSVLHTRRKWFGVGIALLLLTGSLVTILVTRSPKQTLLTVNKPVQNKLELQNSSSQTTFLNKPATNSTKQATINSVNPVAINSFISSTDFNKIVATDFPLAYKNNFYASTGVKESIAPLDVNITDELTDQDIVNNIHPQKTINFPSNLNTSGSYNQTIESVLNSFKRNKKFSVQYYLTPTISYRKLSANKSFLVSAAASSAPSSYSALYNINSVVTHKPDLGVEFGTAVKYALSSNFRIKAGLQFNINRYDIKAFNSYSEVAKIDLRGSRGVDSFYTMSSHRNFNGYKSDWLQNFYFEISLPVGVEMNIVGDDKVQFGLAGTIQPTYILGERAYLLSTDYKNYAQVPWLIRRWNVSTGFETFVSYSTNKMKWQIGPQVRYQLLSSFISKYPVKENLFDFGLKVGLTFNKY